MIKFRSFFFLICFVFSISCFVFPAEAKEYDGIWYLGFNTQLPPFDSLKVRQAVAHALDKEFIARTIVSDEAVPVSFVPPGMPGYDPELRPYKQNIPFAKTLLKRAKYGINDRRLKNIPLLHTDGVKTIAIAQRIAADLRRIGLQIEPVQVSYQDQAQWDRELASGKYPLFLMGYKADPGALFTTEATVTTADSGQLLAPLFKQGGEANFGYFSDPTVNRQFDQLSVLNPALTREREQKLREINRLLYKQLPAVVLFYIERL